MIGSILKTVGICLASLGSFNIQEQRNDNEGQTVDTKTIDPYGGTQLQQLQYGFTTQGGAINVVTYKQWQQTINYENAQVNVITKWQDSQFDPFYDYYNYKIDTLNYGYLPCISSYTLISVTTQSNTPTYIQTGQITTRVICSATGEDFYQLDVTTGIFASSSNRYQARMQPMTNLPSDLEDKRLQFSKDIAVLTIDSEAQKISYNQQTYTKTTPTTQNFNQQQVTGVEDQNYYKIMNKTYYILIFWYGIGSYEAQTYDYDLFNFDLTIKTTNAVITQEVIDVPGLMFDVLTMPFTFWSGAFNMTLFPGTPYQINISTLLLTLLAIAVFVFIIKIFIGRSR